MRRHDRELTDPDDSDSILRACSVCHVALNAEGTPYVVPLNYGFVRSELSTVIYFHCASEGRKLELLAKDQSVSFAIDRELGLITGADACEWGMRYESVLGKGMIFVVSDDAERRHGLQAIMAHYNGAGRAFDAHTLSTTVVLKLVVSSMTGKRKG